MKQPRKIAGYTDIGRPRVPPLPVQLVLEDRQTGTRYLLSHEGSPGSLTLLLNPTIPNRRFDVLFYKPFEEPTVSNGRVRLYIEAGVLRGELLPEGRYISPRVLTRRGFDRTVLEITAAPGWVPGDPFTFTEINLKEGV